MEKKLREHFAMVNASSRMALTASKSLQARLHAANSNPANAAPFRDDPFAARLNRL